MPVPVVIRCDSEGRYIDPNSIDQAVQIIVSQTFGKALYKITEDCLRIAVNYCPIKTGLLRSTGNVRLGMRPVITQHLMIRQKEGPATRIQVHGIEHGASSVATVGDVRGAAVFNFDASARKESAETVSQAAAAAAKSGDKFTFRIGFATPYAFLIHEGKTTSGRKIRWGVRTLRATGAVFRKTGYGKKVYTYESGYKEYMVWRKTQHGYRTTKKGKIVKAKPFGGRVGSHYLLRAWNDNQSKYFSYLDRLFKGEGGIRI